jgi:hypothetical protein
MSEAYSAVLAASRAPHRLRDPTIVARNRSEAKRSARASDTSNKPEDRTQREERRYCSAALSLHHRPFPDFVDMESSKGENSLFLAHSSDRELVPVIFDELGSHSPAHSRFQRYSQPLPMPRSCSI